MEKLVRKNLMVEPESLSRLARRLGLSESATVRHAVDTLLMEDEIMMAAEAIRRRGGLIDVFGRTKSAERAPRKRSTRARDA